MTFLPSVAKKNTGNLAKKRNKVIILVVVEKNIGKRIWKIDGRKKLE